MPENITIASGGAIASAGDKGGFVINDASVSILVSATKVVGCIMPLADLVFTTLTGNMQNAVGVTWPKGVAIFGTFTAITLTSGSCACYYK